MFFVLSLGGPLYSLYYLVDLVVYPAQAPWILAIRIFVGVFLFGSLLGLRWVRHLRQLYWLTGSAYSVSAWGISAMVWLTEGGASPYYAGVNLTTLHVSAFFIWPFGWSLILYGLTLLSYLFAVFLHPGPLNGPLIANNLFYLTASMLVALVASRLRYKLSFNEFLSRHTLRQSNLQLDAIARRDPLTQLLNRQTLEEKLHETLSLNRRYGIPATVILIDLDNFKSVNDELGHAAGDDLLKRTGETLARGTRETDLIFRIGGDEFLVLLQNQSFEQSAVAVSRLQESLDKLFVEPRLAAMKAGASLGLLPIVHQRGKLETVSQLIETVDKILYETKRNRKKQTGGGD